MACEFGQTPLKDGMHFGNFVIFACIRCTRLRHLRFGSGLSIFIPINGWFFKPCDRIKQNTPYIGNIVIHTVPIGKLYLREHILIIYQADILLIYYAAHYIIRVYPIPPSWGCVKFFHPIYYYYYNNRSRGLGRWPNHCGYVVGVLYYAKITLRSVELYHSGRSDRIT